MGLRISARPVSYTHLDVYKRQLLEEAPECVILCSIEVETAYMINEEKVILMTRASLYEEKQKKKACLLYTSP